MFTTLATYHHYQLSYSSRSVAGCFVGGDNGLQTQVMYQTSIFPHISSMAWAVDGYVLGMNSAAHVQVSGVWQEVAMERWLRPYHDNEEF